MYVLFVGKYYKPMTGQYYVADCVSWAPSLTLSVLWTNWLYECALWAELIRMQGTCCISNCTSSIILISSISLVKHHFLCCQITSPFASLPEPFCPWGPQARGPTIMYPQCLLLQLRLHDWSLYIFPCKCAQHISPFITPNWNKNQIKTRCLNLTFSLVYTSAHRSGTYGEKPVHRGHWSPFISGLNTSNEPLKQPIHPTPVPVSQGNCFQGSLFSDLQLLPPSAHINQCPCCRAQWGLSISSAALALTCAAFLLVSTRLWSPSSWTQDLLQLS